MEPGRQADQGRGLPQGGNALPLTAPGWRTSGLQIDILFSGLSTYHPGDW
jgi:hypothetical protein